VRENNRKIIENFKIKINIPKELDFKDLIGVKVQEEGFFSYYKKNRTKILLEKEPAAKVPYHKKMQKMYDDEEAAKKRAMAKAAAEAEALRLKEASKLKKTS
jgi:hypothetical protein